MTTSKEEANVFASFCLQQMLDRLIGGDYGTINYEMISHQQNRNFSTFLNSLNIENLHDLNQTIRFPVGALRQATIGRDKQVVSDAEKITPIRKE